MWFKKLIQGSRAARGGYLTKLEETFADPGRETSMDYWERWQGYTKIRQWRYQKPRFSAADEDTEDVKTERLKWRPLDKTLQMEDEEEDDVKRMPRAYVAKKPRIVASRENVFRLLCNHGFTNKRGVPEPNLKLVKRLDDEQIVDYYGQLARGILDHFRCCDNFKEIKPYVDFHIRYSCLYTLAKKYNESKWLTCKRFTRELLIPVEDEEGNLVEKQCFPTSSEIRRMIRGFSRKSLMDINCPLK